MYSKIVQIGKFLQRQLPGWLFYILGFTFDFFYFIPSGNKKLVQQNKELKDIWKWKRAFLLATWPSINDNDLKILKWEDCFSVSNFFLHKDINTINPKFHFFCPYHKPLILDNYIDWLKSADKALPKNTSIILWHTWKELVDKYKLFPNRKICYLYLTPFPLKNNIDLQYPMLAPMTWPLMILPVLIYMWYKEIYLLWCDHNTLKTYGEDRNDFYDRKQDIRKNAADKNWYWKDIIDALENELNVFKQYKYYKAIADKKWIKIINLSEKSWLDIFEK